MASRTTRWAAAGVALAIVAAVGLGAWLMLARPEPAPPPAPPPPPAKWECGTAYGAEVCERTLPPARPTS